MGICQTKSKEVKIEKEKPAPIIIKNVDDLKLDMVAFQVNTVDKFFSMYRLG
jgi:hypothetical protein